VLPGGTFSSSPFSSFRLTAAAFGAVLCSPAAAERWGGDDDVGWRRGLDKKAVMAAAMLRQRRVGLDLLSDQKVRTHHPPRFQYARFLLFSCCMSISKEHSPDLSSIGWLRVDGGGNPAAGAFPAAGGHGRQRVNGQKAGESEPWRLGRFRSDSVKLVSRCRVKLGQHGQLKSNCSQLGK
jgi:hypothetical protein